MSDRSDSTALSPEDLAQLAASAISPEVIAERGYFTARRVFHLKRYGFGEVQCRVPALGIPIHGPDGRVILYQSRPVAPRLDKRTGKPIKYETPRKASMALDIPPRARQYIGDPSTPLVLTEGVKKGDSAISNGFPCVVALLGVWNFRGTNADGGKVVLPEMEYIAANAGREVTIVFDSDVMRNPNVYAALRRIAGIFDYRGSRVRYVYLPEGTNGAKVGLDDFLAAGHSPDDVLALAEEEVRPRPNAPREGEQAAGPYRMSGAGITWVKDTHQGPILVPLTNFPATIIGNIVEDDGAEIRRILEVSTILHGEVRSIRLSPEKFNAMGWAVEMLGPAAIVFPGTTTKDHSRAAIQMISGDVAEKVVFSHSGWRDRGGEMIFLHGGGAIGACGTIEGIETALPGDLALVVLPDPPEGPALAAAVKASLKMVDVAPEAITIPLLASVYRAALGDADYSIFMVGPTGERKTQLAALCQQHFGAGMDARHLPANWSSTPNSLEGVAFAAKDILAVFDDYAPSGTLADVNRMNQAAERLLRGQGNHAGRQRMTADARLKQGKPSRCLPLITGEDVPKIQSAKARSLIIEVGMGEVDKERLTVYQQAAADGQYAAAMAGFVRWVAPQYDDLQERLVAETARLRTLATTSTAHGRTPGIVGSLAAGWRVFLDFAVECGALSAPHAEQAWQRGWAALGRSVEVQAAHQVASDPVSRFLDLLKSALGGGQAHIADDTGKAPSRTDWYSGPKAWGWRSVDIGAGENSYQEWRPLGTCVGWVDGPHLYLDRDSALVVAQKLGREIGDTIAISSHTLAKRLGERGLLASREATRGTNTVRRMLQGVQRNVLHLSTTTLAPPGEDEPAPDQHDDPAA